MVLRFPCVTLIVFHQLTRPDDTGMPHGHRRACKALSGNYWCLSDRSPALSFSWLDSSSGLVMHNLSQLSLSRLNHGQPGVQAHPEIVQGTAEPNPAMTSLPP